MPKKKTEWDDVEKVMKEKEGEKYKTGLSVDEAMELAERKTKQYLKEARETTEKRIEQRLKGLPPNEQRAIRRKAEAELGRITKRPLTTQDISDVVDKLGEDIDQSLERAYEATNPGFFRKMLDYLTSRHPKSGKRHYLFFILLFAFSIGFIFAFKKGSITGNITTDFITKNSYGPYLLIFILIGVIYFYSKEKL